jgi:starch synthase (maltosyl-transferring)
LATRKTDRRASTRRFEYLVIESVTPEIDGGRYPEKRIVGDSVSVGADILASGADHLAARVIYRGPDDDEWSAAPMEYDFDTDRWHGTFTVDRVGRWTFTVEAWTDRFGAWRAAFQSRLAAGADVTEDLAEGARMARAASRSTRSAATRASLVMTAKVLEDRRGTSTETRIQRALDEEFLALMQDYRRPADLTRARRAVTIAVDRERAGFAAWYDLPHGSLAGPSELAHVADLGFDVVSLRPEDAGSLADFDAFARTAHDLGLEISLDYALHCSPDHPWVTDHPDWFRLGSDVPDSSADDQAPTNPYVYPLDFWCDDRAGLWNACRDVLVFWIERGVNAFSVENPQDKPFAFWEWLIHDVQRDHPNTIFFARVHARPKRVEALAKLGFTMSYTYFPWKTKGPELRAHLEELTRPPWSDFFRGNLVVNPPDVVNEYLQNGGRPAFRARLLLAGTLLPLYGVHGSSDVADAAITTDIQRLNRIRRRSPALQRATNLTFHVSENPAILFYRKTGSGGDLLIAVNTDPQRAQDTVVHVPIRDLGIPEEQPYMVRDLLTDATYMWRGARNYVRLDPGVQPGHIFIIEPASQ